MLVIRSALRARWRLLENVQLSTVHTVFIPHYIAVTTRVFAMATESDDSQVIVLPTIYLRRCEVLDGGRFTFLN